MSSTSDYLEMLEGAKRRLLVEARVEVSPEGVFAASGKGAAIYYAIKGLHKGKSEKEIRKALAKKYNKKIVDEAMQKAKRFVEKLKGQRK